MFILVFGDDGVGKSIQCQKIAAMDDCATHLSFAVKNRRLYRDSGIISNEILRFNEDSTINPYKTIDAYHDAVNQVIKENVSKVVILDEITFLRTWAQPVVLEELNRSRKASGKPILTKIGEQNLAAWARVNQIVYAELERLANWAEINESTVIAITSISEKRRTVQDDNGETHSVQTGEIIANAKENIRKLADIRIRIEKDGKHGKGYYAIFEKYQAWMNEGTDVLKVGQDGILNELVLRGVL
jgi:broad-specificity NMP kinase